MVHILRVSITFMYYKLDPVGFIETLCENKDKPELQCNGKCHLKKISESSADENEAVNLIDFKELILYKQEITNYVMLLDVIDSPKGITTYLNLYHFKHSNSCFHPPQV